MRSALLISITLAATVVQCGSGQQQGKVLASTSVQASAKIEEPVTDKGNDAQPEKPPADALVIRIQEDELRSAEVIRESLAQKEDKELAAWAAVYALRLGIQHDRGLSKHGLLQGAKSKDPLLAALCWRWIAAREDIPMPVSTGLRGFDPVVRAIAALASASKGVGVKGFEDSLGLPDSSVEEGSPISREDVKNKVEEMLFLTFPIDDGPLALAIVFVESRRQEWTEIKEDGKPEWVAKRLGQELAEVIASKDPKAKTRITNSKPAAGAGFTAIPEMLMNAFLKHSSDMLHSIAVTGDLELRIKALEALAVVTKEPLPADFGAAAAALIAKNKSLRLAGAVTFLVFSIKARKPK